MSEQLYRFRGFYIPERMMDGLNRYIHAHVEPGGFLRAVLQNNLKEACGMADDENLKNLPAFVSFLYNHAPMNCWGSRKIYDQWVKNER